MPSWLNDFEVKNKVITVKATGAALPLSLGTAKEVLAWFPFYLAERARRGSRIFGAKPDLTIAYSPIVPRPWYLLPALTYRAKITITEDCAQADAVMYFEDKTQVAPPAIPSGTKRALNFGCYDISKSKVASVFKDIFGYDLAVDPRTYTGPVAVKSELNGAHDGYAVTAPLTAEHPYDPDMVYQRLIDNTVDDTWIEDMRCPVVGGEIALIFVKRRPLATRFANMNSSVTLRAPEDLLSSAERADLKCFAAAMALDFGGMDVLRDKADGRIYVVDVNKTDMGPPLALSMKDKSKSVDILSKQLIRLIKDET